MARVVAEVQSLSSHPDGTEVEVRVVGPKAVPDDVKRLRARAQALIAANPSGAVRRGVENVTAGEIDRLTEITGGGQTSDTDLVNGLLPGNIDLPNATKLESTRYTVVVKDD